MNTEGDLKESHIVKSYQCDHGQTMNWLAILGVGGRSEARGNYYRERSETLSSPGMKRSMDEVNSATD